MVMRMGGPEPTDPNMQKIVDDLNRLTETPSNQIGGTSNTKVTQAVPAVGSVGKISPDTGPGMGSSPTGLSPAKRGT